jgi:hypothetical protein
VPWREAKTASNQVALVPPEGACTTGALRIENPGAVLVGVQQLATMQSTGIYRLSGRARSRGQERGSFFGGRIALYLPPQPEIDVVWPAADGAWSALATVFTNTVGGCAVVYVHMGFGKVPGTGEFTDIRLEQLGAVAPEPVITNRVERISGAATAEYTSVFAALRACGDNDIIIIRPGVYREANAGAEWLMARKRNVTIRGMGTPVIEVEAADPGYQISLQVPHNEDTAVEGVCLRTIVRASNNRLLYGAVFTGCKNLRVSNCIFQAELYGTNAVFKNFTAVNGATNVVVVDSAIITLDMTGSNTAHHVAAHDAAAPLFANTAFLARRLEGFALGTVNAVNCSAEKEWTVSGAVIPAAPLPSLVNRMVPGSPTVPDE